VAKTDSWNSGDLVDVVGLNGRPDLNGRRAEVLHWDSISCRFAVVIASTGEKVKVREANLVDVKRLLVTVISGFSETGKSALVQHALTAGRQEGLRVGLLINDASAEATQPSQSSSLNSKCPKLVGGCICCNLRPQFVAEVIKLAEADMFDYLIVESDDNAEPRQIAQIFCASSTEQVSSSSSVGGHMRRRRVPSKGLSAYASLDTMVSVVDGTSIINFLHDTNSVGSDSQVTKDDSFAQQIVHQAEFADMIIVSNVEHLTEAQIRDVKSLLGMMNPEAGCIFARPSDVPTFEVLGRGAYMWQEFQVQQPTRKWLEEQAKTGSQRVSSAFAPGACMSACCALPGKAAMNEPAGVGSFTFRPARPFHPARVFALANGTLSLPSSALRVTGTCWLASRCAQRGLWSTVRGGRTEITLGAPWWVGVPRTKWPATVESQLIEKGFLSVEGGWQDEQYGDCHSELSVTTGQGFRADVFEVYLTELLLTDEEYAMGPTIWTSFEDPLPAWSFQLDVDVLYCLALIGAEGMLEALCSQGADVNAQNSINSGSALHAACLKGRPKSVKILLHHGADSSLLAQRDLTALHLASSPEVVHLLFQHRCHLEPVDTKGETPLHHAAALARASVVSALLSCRANVNTLTIATSETPLHLASASGHAAAPEVVRVLRAACADLSLVSGASGLSALDLARQIGAHDVAELLAC